ncbi:hypothetical protein INP83_12710 [Mucilaginibacter sp. 21P]|uniref:hypothetical protein n=1 Tax=Mucilaginibacter sp. 21P TaxID=2778902 RepID=UPI001C5A3F01|nr:hypothetical protein [Mucilaginibacter sp. 21P]QXV63960.1 hypothetical protein INP83_12710 [Mucilaginibacter sp. 21P]
MKLLTRPLLVFLLAGPILSFGCRKSDEDKVRVDSHTTYSGMVITKSCPSYAFIKITNANIGENWEYDNKTYDHVIAIANCPTSVSLGASISFSIDTQSNYQDCLALTPCTQVIFIAKMPSGIYCAKDLKTQ